MRQVFYGIAVASLGLAVVVTFPHAAWGYPSAVDQVMQTFAQYLVGQDPMRIEHHWQYLYRMAPFRGNIVSGAVSAVDIALWDIKGQRLQAPIWELLGGRCRDKVRLHLLFSRQLSSTAPKAVTGLLSSDRAGCLTTVRQISYHLLPPRWALAIEIGTRSSNSVPSSEESVSGPET